NGARAALARVRVSSSVGPVGVLVQPAASKTTMMTALGERMGPDSSTLWARGRRAHPRRAVHGSSVDGGVPCCARSEIAPSHLASPSLRRLTFFGFHGDPDKLDVDESRARIDRSR